MIYGDDTVKINERKSANQLGLTSYTLVPDINAIQQSGNLYVYALNNPILFTDLTGLSIGKTIKEGWFAIRHPVQALLIGAVDGSNNISSKSARFAVETGLMENPSHEGSQINAVRHGIWSVTITRRFGVSSMQELGFAHETFGDMFGIFCEMIFSGANTFFTLALADAEVDILNNQIGILIAKSNPFGSRYNMQKVTLEVLDHYYKKGFFVAELQSDGRYEIVLQKLTEQEYNDAVKNINSLDKKGRKTEIGGCL